MSSHETLARVYAMCVLVTPSLVPIIHRNKSFFWSLIAATETKLGTHVILCAALMHVSDCGLLSFFPGSEEEAHWQRHCRCCVPGNNKLTKAQHTTYLTQHVAWGKVALCMLRKSCIFKLHGIGNRYIFPCSKLHTFCTQLLSNTLDATLMRLS